ncbi:hypothetical protein F5Y06DRAFT_297284 [Hypoxylon sp. FL0890]|nr:hypothetical protein F5Y06DRAFT_297284 [Hypoxylon sp. FL0890]
MIKSNTLSYLSHPSGTLQHPQGPLRPALGAQGPLQPTLGAQGPLQPALGAQGPLQPTLGAQGPLQPALGAQGPLRPALGAQGPLQPTLGTQPATYHNAGAIYYEGRDGSQHVQPDINSTQGNKIGYAPRLMPGKVLLANTDLIADGTRSGIQDAKRNYATRQAAKNSYYTRDKESVKLRIHTHSCQYYVNGEGDEATFVPTNKINNWVIDVAVPCITEQTSRSLHDWLVSDIVRKFKPSERAICANAAFKMEFVSYIKVTQAYKIKIIHLKDYHSMTVGSLLNKETMPWKLIGNITKNKSYNAYVIVYRDLIPNPIKRPRAKPILSSPVTPTTSATPATPATSANLRGEESDSEQKHPDRVYTQEEDDPFLSDNERQSLLRNRPRKRLSRSASIPTIPAHKRVKELDDDPSLGDSGKHRTIQGRPSQSLVSSSPNAARETDSSTNNMLQDRTRAYEKAETANLRAHTPPIKIIDLTSDSDDLPDIMTAAKRERWFSPSRKLVRAANKIHTGPTRKGDQDIVIKKEPSSPDNVELRACKASSTAPSDSQAQGNTQEKAISSTGQYDASSQDDKPSDIRQGLANKSLPHASTTNLQAPSSKPNNSSSPAELQNPSKSIPSPNTSRKRKLSQSSTRLAAGEGPITRRRAHLQGSRSIYKTADEEPRSQSQRAITSQTSNKALKHVYHTRGQSSRQTRD